MFRENVWADPREDRPSMESTFYLTTQLTWLRHGGIETLHQRFNIDAVGYRALLQVLEVGDGAAETHQPKVPSTLAHLSTFASGV